jgi:hypothetical protein
VQFGYFFSGLGAGCHKPEKLHVEDIAALHTTRTPTVAFFLPCTYKNDPSGVGSDELQRQFTQRKTKKKKKKHQQKHNQHTTP